MTQYSKTKFNKILNKLTIQANNNDYYGMPMNRPYVELSSSINRGNAVRLYRYQKCTLQNIEDIKRGRLHLSNPSNYNDIYDSQPIFNIETIRLRMSKAITYERMKATILSNRVFVPQDLLGLYDETMRDHLENLELNKRRLIDTTERELRERYNRYRAEIHCACFSSDMTSTAMWGTYADNCSGFVAIYDLNPRQIKCWCSNGDCENRSVIFSLCPVVYDGRFDMSEFSHVLMDSCMMFPYPAFANYMTLVHSTIHKSDEWSHEKEWRLFSGTCNFACEPIYAKVSPVGLITGPRISREDASSILELGSLLGIPVKQAIADFDSKSNTLRIEAFGNHDRSVA